MYIVHSIYTVLQFKNCCFEKNQKFKNNNFTLAFKTTIFDKNHYKNHDKNHNKKSYT